MTDVYLRYNDLASGVKIGEVPFTETAFEDVVRIVKTWGVYVDESDYQDFESASFRLSGDRAYFEIVLGDER